MKSKLSQPIVIVGFMGSGKTTIARELAAYLKCDYVDLDQLISQQENLSASQIIEQRGEDEFRKLELRTLQKSLSENPNQVFALGGGAWTIPENQKLIQEARAAVVWLDAPFEDCWQRIEAGGDVRPLAKTMQEAEKLFEERRPIYEKAQIHIRVDRNQQPHEITKKIAEAILK